MAGKSWSFPNPWRAVRKGRLAGLLLLTAVLAVAYGVHFSLAHARHLRRVASQTDICCARASINFNRFDHDLASIYGLDRSLDETILFIDQVSAELHVHEDGSIRFEDDTVLGYLRLCGDTLREERRLVALAAQYVGTSGRPALAGKNLEGRSGAEVFDMALAQRKRLREALTELESRSSGIAEVLPGSILVDRQAISHFQHEIEQFQLEVR